MDDAAASGQQCTVRMILQQVILETSPLTATGFLNLIGQKRHLHVEIEPIKVRVDKPMPKSGPGELQNKPVGGRGSGEVWLWDSDAKKKETGAKLQIETIDTAELMLRVMETRKRWGQPPVCEVRGVATFVPAYAMQSELTLHIQKDDRTCGVVRMAISRDGLEVYSTDANQETLVTQISPHFDPGGNNNIKNSFKTITNTPTEAPKPVVATTTLHPEQKVTTSRGYADLVVGPSDPDDMHQPLPMPGEMSAAAPAAAPVSSGGQGASSSAVALGGGPGGMMSSGPPAAVGSTGPAGAAPKTQSMGSFMGSFERTAQQLGNSSSQPGGPQ